MQFDLLICGVAQLEVVSDPRSKPINIINIGRTCSRSDNIDLDHSDDKQ
jgi:hypothetical protein